MRILIIGGGIAGSGAALALHKAGFEPVVHEAHPYSTEDFGAFLALAGNGMRALAQVGARHVVADLGFPLTALRLIDASGAKLAESPLGVSDDPLTRHRNIRRADVGVALQREVECRGIEIRHGARLDSFAEDSEGITASFTDGHSATGDLLIGADGLNSKVRALITGGTVRPRYSGKRVYYGSTTQAPADESGYLNVIRGSCADFGYAQAPDGEAFWFAAVPDEPVSADEAAGTRPEQWRDRLIPLLRPDATPAADIVAATSDRLMVTNGSDLPTGIAWRTPRSLIIGDAAHAATPATGQGASMALEDAVVLAKALRDASCTEEGLSVYERVRRPRVERNIVNSAERSARRLSSSAHGNGKSADGQAPAQRPAPTAPATDDQLIRELDWMTPLPM